MTATDVDVTAMLQRLQVLEDRAALDDLVKRYALGCDTKDRDVLLSVFATDARAKYAGDEPMHGAQTIVDWIAMMTATSLWQQHLISPYSFEVDGDRAGVIAYLISHQNFDTNPNVTTMMSSRYVLQCVRTDAGWQISDLNLQVGWIESRFGDQAQLP
jgi:hypothetical protein